MRERVQPIVLDFTAFRWRKVRVRINVRRSSDDNLPGVAILATPFAGIVPDQSLELLPRTDSVTPSLKIIAISFS
ncbi:hypothetical protein TNCV_3835191 [Trichonephila clavipes]|nr:hypothetical protein TNCV_3835191 [Trichonephila clavipes]